MDIAVLSGKRRTVGGRAAACKVRKAGLVPAVLYGHKQEVIPLAIPLLQARVAVEAGSRLVRLEVDGVQEHVLIKEVQYDSLGNEILHIDFARVALDEKVTVTVPIELHGTPKGIHEGGVLDQPLRRIELQCLVRNIPDVIRVEVADLGIGGTIHVRDLKLPEGAVARLDGDILVAAVREPKAEAAPAAPPEEAPTEPERIGEKERAEREKEKEEAAEQK